MFPLVTVLFPTGLLPLHVFEPRYRRMLADLLAGDRMFGVVLIERGSEVGGGDVRSDVGTAARVVEARPTADGRWSVAAVGIERIRVLRWLAEDPYPLAEVAGLPDVPSAAGVDEAALVEGLAPRLRRLLAVLGELGEPVAHSTFELSGDAGPASFQLAALAPLGAYDRQRLLAHTEVSGRLGLLDGLLAEVEADVAGRAPGGGIPPGD